MSNKFQLPERPWGEAEIKSMMAHKEELDAETRAELGLDTQPKDEPDTVQTTGIENYEASKPEEGPVAETPSEETTEEVETEEEVTEPKEETVEKVDEQEA